MSDPRPTGCSNSQKQDGRYVIMKIMCPPVYHLNGFVLYIYVYVYILIYIYIATENEFY